LTKIQLLSNMVSGGLCLFNFTISRLIELLFLKLFAFDYCLYYGDFGYNNFKGGSTLSPIKVIGILIDLIFHLFIKFNIISDNLFILHHNML